MLGQLASPGRTLQSSGDNKSGGRQVASCKLPSKEKENNLMVEKDSVIALTTVVNNESKAQIEEEVELEHFVEATGTT